MSLCTKNATVMARFAVSAAIFLYAPQQGNGKNEKIGKR